MNIEIIVKPDAYSTYLQLQERDWILIMIYFYIKHICIYGQQQEAD